MIRLWLRALGFLFLSVCAVFVEPLEGAPVPVARHAGSDLGALGGSQEARRRGNDGARNDGAGRGGAGRIGALVAPAAAAVTALPYLKFGEAVKADAGQGRAGVELAVLVKGDELCRMRSAEDVAAAAAVVATVPCIEVALAGRVVAHGRLGVGLWSFVSIRSLAGYAVHRRVDLPSSACA